MKVFHPHGRPRIVLATNVAETSLTVPGIRYVIDPGYARMSRYSPRTKVQRLPIERISQASADQRKGRCGRVAAGICIRLYAEDDFASRPAYTEPEILRTHLASVILQMKALGLGDIQEFPFIEPPDYRAIRDGYQTLHELGAIDDRNELTPLGRDMARLPIDPRIGRMVLAARDEDVMREVLVIAAALSVQDPRERPLDKQDLADARPRTVPRWLIRLPELPEALALVSRAGLAPVAQQAEEDVPRQFPVIREDEGVAGHSPSTSGAGEGDGAGKARNAAQAGAEDIAGGQGRSEKWKMNLRATLRDLLRTQRPLIMPDAYDGLSARLIEMIGFKAVQCSGFSMALASRAIPEARLGLEDNLKITRDIVQAVKLPVMADGEDGFGPPARVFETVGAYIDAGIAGINIEDQVLPPTEPKRVVDVSVMKEKIRAAREAAAAKNAADLVVNGRTDVLAARTDRKAGLLEAVERGNEYVGADLIFVVGVNTIEEARQLVRGIRGPVSIAAGLPNNIGTMSIRELRECGVARVSLPSIAVLAAAQAVRRTLSMIYRDGTFDEVMQQGLVCGMDEVARIVTR